MARLPIKGVSIFYCYANEDEGYLKELDKQLGALKRLGKVTTWYDRDIAAGMIWQTEIETHLDAADIILILVSPDFMDSDYCYNVEMRRALQRHAKEGIEVIPVILRSVQWHDTPLGKLQAMPYKGKPISLWNNRDEAFEDAVKGITVKVKSQLAQQWKDEGKAQYMASNNEEAQQAYEEAVKLDANNADSHKDKGHVLLKLNRYEDALEAYDEAIHLQPQNPQLYIHKGNALHTLKRDREALVTYNKALDIDDKAAYTYVHKGNVLLELQRPDEALRAFEEAIQLNPNIGDAYNGIGRALDTLGRLTEAQQAYQQAHSLGR